MTESFPFHSWMPKPAGVAVLLALFVPLFFSGGTYLSNINEMAGSMGVQTEEFQFLSLCASIGMSMVFPFMVPYLRGRNVKAVYIGGYAVLALLNVVCAVSRNLPLLALCSFLIGFVRVALVLNITFVIAPYMLGINTLDMFLHDPPTASEAYRGEHARTVLMPVLYCYILCIVQFSNFVSAWMAYEFSWEYTYWLVVGMMLAAILLVMLTFCKAPSQGCRLSSSRLPDAVLLVVAMGALCYMLVFGKTLDWFDSRSMRVALAVAAVGGGLYLWLAAHTAERPLLEAGVFGHRYTWYGIGIFVLLMLVNSSTLFVTTYLKLSTCAGNLDSARVSCWAMPGCVAGMALSLVCALPYSLPLYLRHGLCPDARSQPLHVLPLPDDVRLRPHHTANAAALFGHAGALLGHVRLCHEAVARALFRHVALPDGCCAQCRGPGHRHFGLRQLAAGAPKALRDTPGLRLQRRQAAGGSTLCSCRGRWQEAGP